tara:strand:- start:421 stop:666 length:246 start_codon:yes stop_codon:yes gene_type:complete
MKNSEKLVKLISSFIENGILTSKDVKNELYNNFQFKKEDLINKLQLVSKKDFDVLKKIVQKQSKEIDYLKKKQRIKKAKKL